WVRRRRTGNRRRRGAAPRRRPSARERSPRSASRRRRRRGSLRRRSAYRPSSRLRAVGKARIALVCSLPHEADLLHEGHEVVEEVLLDDLAVVPAGDGAEVDLEGLTGWRNLLAVGTSHGASHRAREPGDRARPVARREERLVGTVVQVLVGEGLEERDRFGAVRVDAVGRRLPGPAYDG